MMKGQKGITLVALVITIIVMLILAGVTISIVVNGGLFDNAATATTETREKAIDEQIQLCSGSVQTLYYVGKTETPVKSYTNAELATEFVKLFTAAKVDATATVGGSGNEHIVTVKNTTTNQTRTVSFSINTTGQPIVDLTDWTPVT